jgi:hypothetical protein
MNKLISLILFTILTSSFTCSLPEPEANIFTVDISNETSKEVRVFLYRNRENLSEPSDSLIIAANSSLFLCDYISIDRPRFLLCPTIQTLKFKFETDLGYICTSPTNSGNPFCFSNKNPFRGISRVDESDPFSLVFRINEFDLENALEIPD